MTRVRVAVLLGVVAALAVVATVVVAVTTYVDRDEPAAAEDPPVSTRTVTDPGSSASFEVPSTDWRVRDEGTRIYYEDSAGDPGAVVRGPAVFRDGYCAAKPEGSYRGFAGFTRQRFAAWVEALGPADAESREEVTLDDGSAASLQSARLPGGGGSCGAAGVELAMVTSGDVRLVLVADTGESDTLSHEEILAVLTSLRPG